MRNRAERLISRLNQARRIATRYEKRGENYLAMIHIGMILLWLKPFADTALLLGQCKNVSSGVRPHLDPGSKEDILMLT